MNQITQITDQQDELIPLYMEKWRGICLSTQRIDYSMAIEAVGLAYMALRKPMPEIRFFESPFAVLLQFFGPRFLRQHLLYQRSLSEPERHNPLKDLLGKSLKKALEQQFENNLINQIQVQIDPALWGQLKTELYIELGFRLWSHIDDEMTNQLFRLRTTSFRSVVKAIRRMQPQSTYPAAWTVHSGLLDFCISVLRCRHDVELWNVHRLLVKECGWLFPFEHFCLVCDRPSHLFYTNDRTNSDVFHAEGKPAIRFHDNFRLYCYNGELVSEVAAIAMNN
ncbi:hypothetical protein H6G89_23400 [Oscillatoria sp. FACHB-1407]|uniref:DUF6745 domain-containing protein n=1 Tax=Oscillatoria sp. FACHB-1407 TaxID=2692847 RepID=UPI001683EB04|nr:hypothetical protein [Oscillatoria sp. FACHB-1407]MBD2463952.1 hypothetical protein [Oscillatoria sp. FACHB-1407]